MSDSEDNAGVPLVEPLSDSASPKPQISTKRKRDAEGKKSAKRRKLKKPKDVEDDALDAELGVNHAIGKMDDSLMADHIAQRTRRFRSELSLVEAEDIHIPAKTIVDTTSFEPPRIADNLPQFLEENVGGNRKQYLHVAPKEKGSPHTLIVAGAGLRAADLTRAMRKFKPKEGLVAKLFAKHIKLKESIDTVTKNRINIGIGTPQRIIDLLESGALKLQSLERIIVDASHIDQKKRGVLDMKETQVPLVELLTGSEIKACYDREKPLKLLFF